MRVESLTEKLVTNRGTTLRKERRLVGLQVLNCRTSQPARRKTRAKGAVPMKQNGAIGNVIVILIAILSSMTAVPITSSTVGVTRPYQRRPRNITTVVNNVAEI